MIPFKFSVREDIWKKFVEECYKEDKSVSCMVRKLIRERLQ